MGRLSARQERILKMLVSDHERSVGALARGFRVSPMTIRRDLAALEAGGKVVRTWGGAMLTDRAAFDFSFREKALRNAEEKGRIGRAAAALVKRGDSVFFDTGTTTLQVARALKGLSGIQVFTCSLAIVSELFNAEGIVLNMLGGVVNRNALEVYGPLTEKNFTGIRADIAFVGADAVGPSGELLTTDMRVARICELIVQASRKKILVADHSKWKATSPVRYGEIPCMDMVITGRALSAKNRAAIRQHGVELMLV